MEKPFISGSAYGPNLTHTPTPPSPLQKYLPPTPGKLLTCETPNKHNKQDNKYDFCVKRKIAVDMVY